MKQTNFGLSVRSSIRSGHLLLLAAGALLLACGPMFSGQAAAAGQNQLQQAFNSAAAESGVPVNILMAVAYNQSRWEQNSGQSIDGGYGVMDLTTQLPAQNDKGDGTSHQSAASKAEKTLDMAANLTKIPAAQLRTDSAQNIRGGAAVLAAYAKQVNQNRLPAASDTASWYAAVAHYIGAPTTDQAQSFAEDVFTTMRSGETKTTANGQALNLPSNPAMKSSTSKLAQAQPTAGQNSDSTKSNSTPAAECPAGLDCRFIPAAYAQTDPNNPAVYGNYDPANRPKDMKPQYIIIHDTEGSYDSAIKAFQDPAYEISSQYVIRSSDGQITQMVKNSDVAFGAGDFYVNMHGINIEHEGVANQGAAWYTEAMYKSSAKLVRFLSQKYGIPMDREHIIGHDDVPAPTGSALVAQHYDPGPYWDWNHYMALVNNESDAQYVNSLGTKSAPAVGQTVTIAPNFKTYQQIFTGCDDSNTNCVPLPKQSSSAVPLHTKPSDNSPLVSDKYAHPDGSAGTNHTSDWGATVSSGQQFVVADRQNNWTAISEGGQTAWFYDPGGAQQVSRVITAPTFQSASGALKVYGVAYPETSVYPKQVPPPAMDVLYSVPAKQRLSGTTGPLQTDYFYDATFDYSKPYDHDIFRGKTKYYEVQINHRIGYVKADDVTVQ